MKCAKVIGCLNLANTTNPKSYGGTLSILFFFEL